MNTTGENGKLKLFLLGRQSEQEAAEIGVRIIAEPDFAEQMSLAEEELVEDFFDGTLTTEEKEFFYMNFLTPARAELVRETALLRNYAAQYSADYPERTLEEKKSGNFLDGLRGFLSLNLRPVAAVLVILVLAGIAWRVFFYDGGSLTQIEKEYAALNTRDLSSAPEIANLPSKSLIEGTFRDTNAGAKLKASDLTGDVLFRLALPAQTPADARFNLELLRGGQTVFRQTDLRVYQNPNGQELKVVLPKSVLLKGMYQIKLDNGAAYGFAVE